MHRTIPFHPARWPSPHQPLSSAVPQVGLLTRQEILSLNPGVVGEEPKNIFDAVPDTDLGETPDEGMRVMSGSNMNDGKWWG